MRIALFLPHLGVNGGLGVHCRALLTSLLRQRTTDTYTVLSPAKPEVLFPLTGLDSSWRPLTNDPRVTHVPLDWPADVPLSHPLDGPLAGPVAAAKPDVLLCSYYTGMQHPPCPQAIVFHDAGFLEFPQVFGETARLRQETVDRIRPAIARLVCVSADARDRACRLLPFDPQQTSVVWHALSDSPAELQAATDINWQTKVLWKDGDRLADWGPYIFLPVGAATGFNRVRKNVPTAVSAFRQLDDLPVKLAIASTGVLNETMLHDLLPESERSHGSIERGAWRSADGRILILPNLERSPFLAAMARSSVVLYPSRYEGFGLPAIEAMAVGVPLVAGQAASLPEVVGDAGVLVPPDDAAGFANAIRRILADVSLREELVKKGRERVKFFTVDQMGERMRKVFLELTAGK